MKNENSTFKSRLSRRDMLRLTAFTATGAFLAACGPAPATPAPATPAPATQAPAAEATPTPAPAAEATPTPAPTKAAAEQMSLRLVTNHGESDVPLFKKVIQNFEGRNPNIKIEYLDIAGGGDFYTTINAQGAGGDLPDIWYTRTFDVPVYASKKWTVDLQSLIDRDAAEVNVEDFWPAEVAQMKWEGNLYALPYDFSNIGIYYNKNMFDQAGVSYPPASWKWADLVDLALKFIEKDASGAFTKWGLVLYTWNWVFMGLLFGWGGKVWTDDFRKCIADSPENRECLTFFTEARKKGVYPEAGATPQGVEPFGAGLVPMSFQGSWATKWMRDTIGDKFDFDCTAMPLSPSGASCLNAAGGAWGIAVNTKHLEEAWTFNKHLTSTESTNILISEPLRSIPGRKSSVPLWEQKAAEGGLPPKNVNVFAEQNEKAHAAPYPPYWQDFSNTWVNIIDPLLNGQVTDDVGTVLANFQNEVNRIIEQYYQG